MEVVETGLDWMDGCDCARLLGLGTADGWGYAGCYEQYSMGIGGMYILSAIRLIVLSFDIRLRHTAAEGADDRRPERLGGAFHPFLSNGFSEGRVW